VRNIQETSQYKNISITSPKKRHNLLTLSGNRWLPLTIMGDILVIDSFNLIPCHQRLPSVSTLPALGLKREYLDGGEQAFQTHDASGHCLGWRGNILPSPNISRIVCCDRGYGRPSGRPRVSDPATYCSSTPQVQLPAFSLWHSHLHGLATTIHEISGLAGKSRSAHGLSSICEPQRVRVVIL